MTIRSMALVFLLLLQNAFVFPSNLQKQPHIKTSKTQALKQFFCDHITEISCATACGILAARWSLNISKGLREKSLIRLFDKKLASHVKTQLAIKRLNQDSMTELENGIDSKFSAEFYREELGRLEHPDEAKKIIQKERARLLDNIERLPQTSRTMTDKDIIFIKESYMEKLARLDEDEEHLLPENIQKRRECLLGSKNLITLKALAERPWTDNEKAFIGACGFKNIFRIINARKPTFIETYKKRSEWGPFPDNTEPAT